MVGTINIKVVNNIDGETYFTVAKDQQLTRIMCNYGHRNNLSLDFITFKVKNTGKHINPTDTCYTLGVVDDDIIQADFY